MRKPIAKIMIAAGNPGWYDSLTNTHLTITNPMAFVYEGQNVTNIKKAVKFKIVHVIEGELEPVKQEQVIETPEVKVEEVREVIPEPVVETAEVIEEIKETEIVEEPVIEKEVVEEEKPKKTTAKKGTAKKKTVKKEDK